MDFTREPIVETVITPREGYRLVVRSSKVLGSEEHFVEAVEVVAFGNAFFFRSIERPKPFMVPVGDYEILEVRESRIVLKAPQLQEGRGNSSREQQREYQPRTPRVQQESQEEARATQDAQESVRQEMKSQDSRVQEQKSQDARQDKRRDRRRSFRRRRGQLRDEGREAAQEGMGQDSQQEDTLSYDDSIPKEAHKSSGDKPVEEPVVPTLRAVLPPPATLIRDDLQRLRENEMYRGAFFIREEKEDDDDDASLESFAVEASTEAMHSMQEDSSKEEPFLLSQCVEGDVQRDVEDPLSR